VNIKVLAKKVFTLYSLAVQQLSKQDHYDFGLRALVSVLRYAGRKKRSNPNMQDEEVSLSVSILPTVNICQCFAVTVVVIFDVVVAAAAAALVVVIVVNADAVALNVGVCGCQSCTFLTKN